LLDSEQMAGSAARVKRHERELVIPWNTLKKLAVDGEYVTFVSKAKPRGQVWFSAAVAPSELLDQIASAAPR
jgi:hypothetical protein